MAADGFGKTTAQQTIVSIDSTAEVEAKLIFGECGYAHLVSLFERVAASFWSSDRNSPYWDIDLDVVPIESAPSLYELRECHGPLNGKSACVVFGFCDQRREIVVLKILDLNRHQRVPVRWVIDSEDRFHVYAYGESDDSLKEYF